MKKSLKAIIQYIVFLGIGLFFVWLSLRDLNHDQWQKTKEAIGSSRQWLFFPVTAMLLLSHLSRALRWKILIEPLGYKPSTFNSFAAVMIGYLVNHGVPRLGELVKCTVLRRYEKIPVDKLIGTILAERAVDLICLGIVFVLALIFQGEVIGDFMLGSFSNFFSDKTGHLSVLKVIIYPAAFLLALVLFYFALKKLGHINIIVQLKKIIKGVIHGLKSIRYIRQKGLFLFHSLFIWVMYLLSTTAGLYAFRETEHLGIPGGLSALGAGSVGIIVTPGGIGAYPLLIELLMGLYGVAATVGKSMGWLLWAVQTFIVLAGGLICLVLISRINKNNVSNKQ